MTLVPGLARAGIALLAAVAATGAGAAEPVAAGLTFEQALGLAARAPRVAGSEEAARVKREADRAIRRVPYNPQLTVQPGFRLAPEGAKEPELVAEVLQPLPLGGLGRARRAAAADEELLLQAGARAVALEQRLLAGKAWIDLWTAQQVRQAVSREEQIARELLRLVERAAAVEAATRADLADARGFLAEARLQVLAAEGEVHDLGLMLAREAGVEVRGPLTAAGGLPSVALPPPERWSELVERAERLPMPQVATLRLRAERSREAEERAARASQLQLGANLQRDAPGGLVLSAVARLIPSWADRGERERAVLLAEAARLEGARRGARMAAAIEVLAALHEFEHTGEMAEELGRNLVPAASEAAEARARIFQAGEATLPEVLQARRVELAAVSRHQRALGAQAWAKVKLWLLLATIAAAGAPDPAAAAPPEGTQGSP